MINVEERKGKGSLGDVLEDRVYLGSRGGVQKYVG